MRIKFNVHQLQHDQTIHSVMLKDESVHMLVFDKHNGHWLKFSPGGMGCEEVGYLGHAFNQEIVGSQEFRPGAALPVSES